MHTRTMGPGAGWRWFMQGINLGRNNPKAIFGGAGLLLGTVVVLAIALSLLIAAVELSLKPGLGGSMALSLVLMVPILAVLAALMVGYLRLIDAAESGRTARAMDVFAAFKDVGTNLRAIGLVIVLALVQNALVVALIAGLAPDVGQWYLQSLQASVAGVAPQQMTSVPDGLGVAFVVMLVLGLFGYAVQAIALGQIALRERSLGGAFVDGIGGAAKNLLPLFVLAVIVIVASFVLILVTGLLVMLIGVLAKLAGLWLAVVLGIPLYIGALLIAYVVMFGVMYSVWRDVAGEDVAGAAPTADHQLEL